MLPGALATLRQFPALARLWPGTLFTSIVVVRWLGVPFGAFQAAALSGCSHGTWAFAQHDFLLCAYLSPVLDTPEN